MKPNNYLKLVKASALYDLIVTAPFATPWTFKLTHEFLGQIVEIPDYQPMHLLFVNLMGSLVIVWSILRLRHTEQIHGLYDGIARMLFFTWQIYYLVGFQAPWIIGIFAFFEIIFGILQLYGYRKLKSQS